MTTPTGVTIQAVAPDGTTTDVTEAVQAAYDLVHDSMDWGSGFLSVEEVLPLRRLAVICGFEGLKDDQDYLGENALTDEEKEAVRRAGETTLPQELVQLHQVPPIAGLQSGDQINYTIITAHELDRLLHTEWGRDELRRLMASVAGLPNMAVMLVSIPDARRARVSSAFQQLMTPFQVRQ